jgi:allantoinase
MILSSQRVVTPSGVRPASIVVEHGRIVSVKPWAPEGDVGSLWIIPGLVDTHVHLNDPGRAHWEGFSTGTRAAAAGGITTVVDMPLNSIPATTSVAGLAAKREAAAGRCFVDYGFWGGLVDHNLDQIEPLARAGVLGFKCFLVPSGVDEFPMVTEAHLRAALPVIARTRLPLLVHAESPEWIGEPSDGEYSAYLASRPDRSEVAAIHLLIDLCREFRCPIHIVHLSSAEALPDLRRARAGGLPVTVETCPHYLHFAAEDIAAGQTLLKCAPPIRSAQNREKLWEALKQGDIDLVATDHSPCPPEMKAGDFRSAWGGIASLSVALPVVWTEASRRAIELSTVVRWMSRQPARLAGLGGRKGAIAPGFDADLVLFDPDAEFEVTPQRLHYRHPISAYQGKRLRGVVKQTFLRGEPIGENPRGAGLR